MKLVVPYVGALREVEARLVRLAGFLGIACETLALDDVADHAAFLQRAVPAAGACLAVRPAVIQEWVGRAGAPDELVAVLLARFPHLLVHGLRVDAFDSALVAALSQNRLGPVAAVATPSSGYRVADDARPVCEAFAGLSFGPADPANDHVLHADDAGNGPAWQPLISIDGRPFMAVVTRGETRIFFVAGEEVADLDAEVGEAPLTEYFSRLLPHAMALRHMAGDACWRPREAHASIIIDDPLLRKNYGFLNFDALLRLAERHRFHATLAFIPHNFRRNSPRITRLFREHAGHLSICFHGNDHTEAEMASTDPDFLHTTLRVADGRMRALHRATGLACDRVMVFPQGNFSVAGMAALRDHNFLASVNTVPHPTGQRQVRLTLGELARPAVWRYANFPLFMRQSIERTPAADVAFNLFFGRPVLIGEHHDLFQRPEPLAAFADTVNRMAPGIRWSNLTEVVSRSVLARPAPEGTSHVRAYAGSVRVTNESENPRRFVVGWDGLREDALLAGVQVGGTSGRDYEIDDAGLQVPVDLSPGQTQTVSLVYRNDHAAKNSLGLRWNTRAFVRRRLSEVRDNYLSKNERVLTAAKTWQRRLLK